MSEPEKWRPPTLPVVDLSARPEGSMGHGHVTTPEIPLPPEGPHWDYLRDEPHTRDELLELRAWAERQGFAVGGQFMDAIIARIALSDAGGAS